MTDEAIGIDGAISTGARLWLALAAGDDVVLEEILGWHLLELLSNIDELSKTGALRIRVGLTAQECGRLGRYSDFVDYMPDGRIRIPYAKRLAGPPASGLTEVWWLAFADEGSGWRVVSINDRSESGQHMAIHERTTTSDEPLN